MPCGKVVGVEVRIMKRIGLLYHPYKEMALRLAGEWQDEIIARGAPAPLVASAWDERASSEICGQVDLLITLGGDGTLMRAARIAAPCGVPSIGVKLGHVGFLSAFKPEDFTGCIDRLLEGQYRVEERMMVSASLIRKGECKGTYEGVNDVVVSRGRLARVIRIEVSIDGELLDHFAVDGAIVATATGSTAYSLAVGGPILAPTVRTLLLSLISPYLSPIHSLVLPEGARVAMRMNSPLSGMLTVDGQFDIEVIEGDTVETGAGANVARFAHLAKESHFYETLIDRLRTNGD
jgi:NAD+ kinase